MRGQADMHCLPKTSSANPNPPSSSATQELINYLTDAKSYRARDKRWPAQDEDPLAVVIRE